MGGRGSCQADFSANREVDKSSGSKRQRLANGEQRIATGDWRLVEQQESSEWRLVLQGSVPALPKKFCCPKIALRTLHIALILAHQRFALPKALSQFIALTLQGR